jgi:hypothetical protein
VHQLTQVWAPLGLASKLRSASLPVFISCADDTTPLGVELAKALREEGIPAWATFQDLKPGQQVVNEIDLAVGRSEWLIVLIGPKTRSNAWQEAEWSAIVASAWSDPKKRVLPVVVGANETPPFLRNWAPLRVDPEALDVTWTKKVLEALRSPIYGAAHDLPPDAKQEREERFVEIRKIVEQLRKTETGGLPIQRRG